MFTIHRFPPFGKRFFKRIRKIYGCVTFSHLWRLVIAIASISGRKSLSKFTQLFGSRRTRQALSHFLTQAEWDAPELLLENALTMLRKLGWKSGDMVYLVVDDTQKEKCAKRMDAVSKIFLHAKKVYANGHIILGCAFVYRNVVIPCAVRLWASKDYCKRSQKQNNDHEPVQFKKLTDLAAECIQSIRLPSEGKVTVMFDKFYSCQTVTKACKSRGFTYIGAVKANRNFFPDKRERDKRKLTQYGKNVLDREGRVTSISGSKKKHRIAEKVGTMNKLGRVKLAFSRRAGEKTWIILVTNALRWGAKTLIEHYRYRWPIEILFKMSKQHLGLGDYQFLRYTAVARYLHLVMIAHHLLTHLAIERSGEKAVLQGRDALRLPGVERMQAVLRALLFEDCVASIATSKKDKALGRKLRKMLVPAE
jgi:SRSO17 transposase